MSTPPRPLHSPTYSSSASASSTPSPLPPQDEQDVPQFTARAIITGLFVGTIVNFSNMYFGLQTGWVSMMSMPSSLIGFAIFKTLAKQLRFPFTPVENVLVQTVAVAVGSMPLSVGYVGVIPALERLLKPSEGGPVILSLPKLMLWGIGLAFFGVFFAVPLRKQVILREKLRFPSGTATALMISVLHGSQNKSEYTEETRPLQLAGFDDSGNAHRSKEDDDSEWKKQARLLLYPFAVSGVYTLASYFFPILRNLPIFGASAASTWLWTFNPSPAYLGQGIIMGPETTGHMLLGAILGWAILSPLAKHQGWAPGPVWNYQTGSRGWIIWVSLAIMLADSIISLGSVMLSYLTRHIRPSPVGRSSYQPLSEEAEPGFRRRRNSLPDDDAPPHHLVPSNVVIVGLLVSSLLCILTTRFVFPFAPLYAIMLALPLALLLSLIGVRALGQTDLNPVSGISKLTQLLFALIIPRSHPAAIPINLIAGALSEAGAQQAGDIMQDLKTGHLLKASPRAQFYGQLVGGAVGAIVSAGVYRIYANVYPIPGELFQVPTAHVWIDCSRLVYGQGLPDGAREFAAGLGALCAAGTVWKFARPGGWARWVPGGVAVAVGMYNVPSFTLARALGGGVQWWWSRRGGEETAVVVVASGLILGEGIVSLANLGLRSWGAGHW